MMHSCLKWILAGWVLPGLLFLGCAGSASKKGDDASYINKTDKINTQRDRAADREAVMDALDD